MTGEDALEISERINKAIMLAFQSGRPEYAQGLSDAISIIVGMAKEQRIIPNHTRPVKQALNTSGRVGVAWDKHVGKWVAYINVKGAKMNLGKFDSFEEARIAREEAEVKYPVD